MKKIAFTLYVLGILIMLPLVAVLQQNHRASRPSDIESTGSLVEGKVAVDEAYASAKVYLYKRSL
jgi:hypothetical protein